MPPGLSRAVTILYAVRMFGWGGPEGPRNKREFRAAYAILSEDVVGLHGELGRARLEQVRLEAMTQAMGAETARLRTDLAAARAELVELRHRRATDPLLEMLAEQTFELRAQLAENQQTITALTTRLTDLLEAHLDAMTGQPEPAEEDTAEEDDVVAELPTRPLPEPAPVADLRRPEPFADRLRVLRRAHDA